MAYMVLAVHCPKKAINDLNDTGNAQDIYAFSEFEMKITNLRLQLQFPGANELKGRSIVL